MRPIVPQQDRPTGRAWALRRLVLRASSWRGAGAAWNMDGMTTLGVLARFGFKPRKEDDAERFFEARAVIVADHPEATRWYAFRLGPTSYGAFAVFALGLMVSPCWSS